MLNLDQTEVLRVGEKFTFAYDRLPLPGGANT
jgi:hypothetical protein